MVNQAMRQNRGSSRYLGLYMIVDDVVDAPDDAMRDVALAKFTTFFMRSVVRSTRAAKPSDGSDADVVPGTILERLPLFGATAAKAAMAATVWQRKRTGQERQ